MVLIRILQITMQILLLSPFGTQTTQEPWLISAQVTPRLSFVHSQQVAQLTLVRPLLDRQQQPSDKQPDFAQLSIWQEAQHQWLAAQLTFRPGSRDTQIWGWISNNNKHCSNKLIISQCFLTCFPILPSPTHSLTPLNCPWHREVKRREIVRIWRWSVKNCLTSWTR